MKDGTINQADLCHAILKIWMALYAVMTREKVWLIALCVLMGIGLLESGQTWAAVPSRQQMLESPEKIHDWISTKQISFESIPNPHWNSRDCKTCHRNTPIGNALNLRAKNIDELCEYCHTGKLDHSYIHPSDIPISGLMRKNITPHFKQNLDNKGKVTCATCHEITAQCLSARRNEQSINPLFLREGPYRIRSEICYKCHDVKDYPRRNSHDQISDDGKIKEYTCRICHDKKGLDKANSINDVGFNVKDNLVRVCASCHDLKPHPSGSFTFTKKGVPNHLVAPNDEIKKKIKQSEKERGVVLPLDPVTGRVFCGTCHNPHEKGVIKNKAAAKGADEKNRLRTQNICLNCHDK